MWVYFTKSWTYKFDHGIKVYNQTCHLSASFFLWGKKYHSHHFPQGQTLRFLFGRFANLCCINGSKKLCKEFLWFGGSPTLLFSGGFFCGFPSLISGIYKTWWSMVIFRLQNEILCVWQRSLGYSTFFVSEVKSVEVLKNITHSRP